MSGYRQIVSAACAGINWVPRGRPTKAAQCGKCGNALDSGTPLDADAVMFDRQITRTDVLALIDVCPRWCGPCRMMATVFQATASVLEPRLRLNSEMEQDIAGRLGVRAIPIMLLYTGGREIGCVQQFAQAQFA